MIDVLFLYQLALQKGVEVHTGEKVNAISFENNVHTIRDR